MRSWGARADCFVSDEPMYAHYLSEIEDSKRVEHPVYQQVMESQSTDWRAVSSMLTGAIPQQKSIWYQKHMAHHLTDACEWDWIAKLTNCFLIRDPAYMITSFIKVIENPTPEDLGLPQQIKLFEWLRSETGITPTVIDSKDVLANPRDLLAKICERVGVAFDEAMLSWEPGEREEDGVWAPHWYTSVYKSTGFAPYEEKNELVPERLSGVLEECNALYSVLAEHSI
jgi:Sulfotransferase domain